MKLDRVVSLLLRSLCACSLFLAIVLCEVAGADETQGELLPPLPALPEEGAAVKPSDGPKTKEIMAEAAVDALMKELVKEALNKHVKDIAVDGAAYAVGDVALAVVSAYEAGKDWDEAETDSQKFYAGSRFIMGVLGPFTGGTTALVSLAITGNELFYRWGVAEHHGRAAEYAREAAESLARSEKIFTGLARAEYEELRTLVNTRASLKTTMEALGASLQKDCQRELKTVMELDACLAILESQAIGIKRLIVLDMELIRFNGRFISMSKVFSNQGIKWDEAVKKMEASLGETLKQAEVLQSLIGQIIVRKWNLLATTLEAQANLLEMETKCELYALSAAKVYFNIVTDRAAAQAEGSSVDILLLDHHMDRFLMEARLNLQSCRQHRIILPSEFRKRLALENLE